MKNFNGCVNRPFNIFDLAGEFEKSMLDFAPQTGRHYLNVIVDVNDNDEYIINAESHL